MNNEQIAKLEKFALKAKNACYVGGGKHLLPYRQGSHDLQFFEEEWAYHDSYFGGWNFLGEEVVYLNDCPVWGMNYYGYILEPDKLKAEEAGRMIMRSLSAMYVEGRFLGGWTYAFEDMIYQDHNDGDIRRFEGLETIERNGQIVYRLSYHGGIIR